MQFLSKGYVKSSFAAVLGVVIGILANQGILFVRTVSAHEEAIQSMKTELRYIRESTDKMNSSLSELVGAERQRERVIK